MDPLKLLSRGTRPAKRRGHSSFPTPSSGQNAPPQIFAPHNGAQSASKKRKRGREGPAATNSQDDDLNFFQDFKPTKQAQHSSHEGEGNENVGGENISTPSSHSHDLSPDDTKRILREHKLKFTWLNTQSASKKGGRDGKIKDQVGKSKQDKHQLYPQPLQSFNELRSRFVVFPKLARNVLEQGYSLPTEVQLGALPLLLEHDCHCFENGQVMEVKDEVDLLTVAPTGSGKTLAYMIPLVHRIQQTRRTIGNGREKRTSAVILAPTKELAGQIVNEGRKLAHETGVRITQVRKGMLLPGAADPSSGDAQQDDGQGESRATVVKADILVSTPGVLQGIVQGADQNALADVYCLILDEADILLDSLFCSQTLAIWNALPNTGLRVSLWSATMGSNIEELARSTISSRRKRIDAPDAPLVRLVVGLKDSAVSNISHRLVYAATEQGKLMGLRQLLHPTESSFASENAGPPLRPPFLVFTQTIERAIALHSELLYDIPAEAGGISRIAVLHSDLSDTARESVMTKFRKGEIWVLITTDLLSRGVDFRGVNGVVNYDIPTSAAAYVHRVGRTGRAGREGGVAVTLYSKEDVPYLKHVANLVAAAEKQKQQADPSSAKSQSRGENEGIQQWLLDALPDLSKQERKRFKKRGIEARTAKGREANPRAARKARISTKSGYVRKKEQNLKGAVVGSLKRRGDEHGVDQDRGSEASDFDGFD